MRRLRLPAVEWLGVAVAVALLVSALNSFLLWRAHDTDVRASCQNRRTLVALVHAAGTRPALEARLLASLGPSPHGC